jgi:hypothetical protein
MVAYVDNAGRLKRTEQNHSPVQLEIPYAMGGMEHFEQMSA